MAGDQSGGLNEWRSAQSPWNALDRASRQATARELIQRQLGPIRFRDTVDACITSVARVTARGPVVVVAYSGDFTPPGRQPSYQTPLDMPLTISPRVPDFPYGTLLQFLCYEAEVMRIRAEIASQCETMGQRIAAQVRASPAPVTQAQYDAFMAKFASGNRTTRLAAPWMLERMAAEPGAADASCDTSTAASSPSSHDQRIAGVAFLHDVEAERLGREYCSCR